MTDYRIVAAMTALLDRAVTTEATQAACYSAWLALGSYADPQHYSYAVNAGIVFG